MNVSLTPELERLVSEKVASGMYHSASEVVREALRLLHERDELRCVHLRQLRREVARGLEQLRTGKLSEFDAQEIKDAGRRRLAGRST